MRPVRRNLPGVVHHLIWRFVDRRWFFANDAQRDVYLGLLGRALEQSDWRCFAYSLMSSHIHLSVLAGFAPLASWSVRVNSRFASWLNASQDRIGPVFIRGPKDHAILPAKEAALIAYIHKNPSRARIVDDPIESTWTSHRMYLERAAAPKWLHLDEALTRGGLTRATYASWFGTEAGDDGAVAGARAADKTARHRGGIRVATPSIASIPLVARPFAHVRIDPRRLIEIACEVSGVGALIIASRRRISDALEARRGTVFAGRAMGLSDSDIAEALGLSQQGVSKIGARSPSLGEARLCDLICERARFESKW